MSYEAVAKQLNQVMANTYAIYLKTQNYHWHVTGPQFKALHELLDEQYHDLADAVDSIAERIVTLGGHAPATFTALNSLQTLSEAKATQSAQMLSELIADHAKVIGSLQEALHAAQKANDEGSIALIGERIAAHEKQAWMLRASQG